MTRIRPQKTLPRRNTHFRLVVLLLSLSTLNFVSSAVSTSSPSNVNAEAPETPSPTTLIYSTPTVDGIAPASREPTTTQQPEEIIFVTSMKKAQQETRKRELKPVYYGTPSGMDRG